MGKDFTPQDYFNFLTKQEGFKDKIFIDAGQKAIGYGHKLSPEEIASGIYDKGISQLEATNLLRADINKNVNSTKNYIEKNFKGTWDNLSNHAKYLLTDFQFNTKKGVAGFHDMIQGLLANDVNVIKNNYTRQSEGKPLTKRNEGTLETFIKPLVSEIETNQDKFPQDTIKPTLNTPVKLVTDTIPTKTNTPKPTLPIGQMAKPRTVTTGRQPQHLSFGGNLAKVAIGTGELVAGAAGEFFTAGAATPGSIPLMAAGASTIAGGVEGFHNDHVDNKAQQMANLPPTKAGVRLFLNGGNLSPLNNSTAQVQANNPNQQDSVNLPQFNAKVDNGETVDMQKGRVFSDKLGFADLHKPIAKAIGRIEKSGKNDAITQATKLRLQLQEDRLFNAQETFKQMKGIDDNAMPVKKMAYGGGFNPYTGMPYTENDIIRQNIKESSGYDSSAFAMNSGINPELNLPQFNPMYNKTLSQTGFNNSLDMSIPNPNSGSGQMMNRSKQQLNLPQFNPIYNNTDIITNSNSGSGQMMNRNKQQLNLPQFNPIYNKTLSQTGFNNSLDMSIPKLNPDQANNLSNIMDSKQLNLSSIPINTKTGGNGLPDLSKLGAGVTTALEFAPAIYNTMEGLFGKAGKEKPIYANTSGALNTMAGRTYNVNPQLAANRVAFSTALSNARTANPNTGSYMNLGQSAAINKYAADANAYATKQNMDNQYKGELANMQFQDAANRQAAEMQARQMTLANQVTKQNMLAAGLTNTSDIIMNKANTQQQMNMDAYKTSLLPMLFPDVTTKNAPQLYSWMSANGYTWDDKGVYKNGKLANPNAVYNLFKIN